MKQQALKIQKLPHPSLRILMGGSSEKNGIDTLVNTAWTFASSALWYTTIFSTREAVTAKRYIKAFLMQSKNPAKAFVVCCQRVLIAKSYYAAQGSDTCTALPSAWFSPLNPEGFAFTKPGYDAIKTARQSLPNYQVEIKALAEAVLEYTEQPTTRNFNYWRNYFMERNEAALLNLFLVNAIHHHHK